MFGLFNSISQWDLEKGTGAKNKAPRIAENNILGTSAARACLQASPDASLEIHKMLKNQDSLLSLMVAL
jgi:hypothetical protein